MEPYLRRESVGWGESVVGHFPALYGLSGVFVCLSMQTAK